MSKRNEFPAPPSASGGRGAQPAGGLRVAWIGSPQAPNQGDDSVMARFNAQVERFSSAEQAFAAFLERHFDLLFVNLQLRGDGVGGPEFIRLVRNCGHPDKARVPIIGLASQRQLMHADKLRTLGATEFLGVPIDIAELQKKLGQIFGAVEAAQETRNLFQDSLPNGMNNNYTTARGVQQSAADPARNRESQSDATHGSAGFGFSLEHESTVAAMKQKLDFSQPTANADAGTTASERRGLLERLGDKILARLAKTTPGAEADQPIGGTGPGSELDTSPFAKLGLPGPRPPAGRSGTPTPTPGPERDDEISKALRGLSKRAPVTPPAPKAGLAAPLGAEAPAPMAKARPQRPAAAPARSGGRPESTPTPTPAAAAPRGTSQPYVSPIKRRVPVAAPARVPAESRRAAPSPAPAAVPGTRLSDAEKSRVYERVRKLVSTARRAAESQEPSAAPPKPQKQLRVCFLEDSCTSSHAIREMLGEHGHEVDHFSQAEEAFDAFMEKDYDLLLASQIEALGGMDCEQLVRAIRGAKQPAKARTPIVVLTANSDPANLQLFRKAGASDVVVKPVEGKRLHEQIMTVVTVQRMPLREPGGTLRVCFLEDSCTSSHAIREMLGEDGHEVDHFSSAEEALDAVMEKQYDVLLASQIVALGGMDCTGLIETLRRLPDAHKRNLPVVALTANADPANLETFYVAGASDVIVKPIEGKELNRRLQDTVKTQPFTATETAPANEEPTPASALKVCFLEDSCTSSHAIREMLGEKGHEVDHFSSAEEAFDALMEKDYDVLLASQIVALGGMDCEQLVRTLRNDPKPAKRQMAIVVITANPEPANVDKFYLAGASDVVIKPVEGKELNDRIVEVVKLKPTATPVSTPQALPRSLRVCFLEDSCTSSHAIREMLGEAGNEVDHFSSAEEALDAFMEKPYDVMLASQIVALGGLDCEGLVKAIRGAAQPQKRSVPVVVITADADPANVANFKRVGADQVIIKPIEGDLSEQLRAVAGGVLAQQAQGGRPQLRVVPPASPPASAAPRPQAVPAAKPAAPASSEAPIFPIFPSITPQPEPAADARAASAAPATPLFDIKGKKETLPGGLNLPALKGVVTRERKLVFGLAAAALLGAVSLSWHHFFEEALPVQLAAVERGPIFQAFNAPGQVVSKKRVALTSAIAGQIVKVHVKEGDAVKKGQALATMDERDALIQVQRAEANLESTKRDVALNERTLDRLVRALQMGAVSRQMAEDAEAAVHAARAKQRVAQEEYRGAQLAAERLNVIAPFDGVVTENFAVDGLWAEPPGPLFTLVDMTQREVELKVDAADAGRLAVGQRVTMASDAFPGQQWTEQVLRVAPATTREAGMANTVSVYTSLGPDAPELRFGQQVDAQIRTAGNENAIKIPFAAVTMRNDRTVVAVIDDGHVRFRPVVTGIESVTHVEIKDGLKPGDQVIILTKDLEEGAAVTPVDVPG